MKIRTISIFWIALIVCVITATQSQNQVVHAQTPLDIGVCYGMRGDNLPPPTEVIQLYKQYGISKLRLIPIPQHLKH